MGNDEQENQNDNEHTSKEDEQQPSNIADVDDPLLDQIAQSLDDTAANGRPRF